MAQLALGLAGAGIGSVFGYASLGWSIGAALGGFLFPGKKPDIRNEGPRLGDLRVQTSAYGAMIPRVFGTVRLAGNIIDASDLRETEIVVEEGGGKGGPEPTATSVTYVYHVDLDIALCEGEIDGVRRIWKDGELWFDISDTVDHFTLAQSHANATLRFYRGTATQLADPTFEALHGVGNVSGYRGTAHVVMENLEVSATRGVPNFTFEVVRSGAPASSDFYELPVFEGFAMEASDLPVIGRDSRSVYWQGGNPSRIMTSYGDSYRSRITAFNAGPFAMTQTGRVLSLAPSNNRLLIFDRGRMIGQRTIDGTLYSQTLQSRSGGGRCFLFGNFDNGSTHRLAIIDEKGVPQQISGGPIPLPGGGFVMDVSEQESILGVDTFGVPWEFYVGYVRGLSWDQRSPAGATLQAVSGQIDTRAFMHSPAEGLIYAINEYDGHLLVWDEQGALVNDEPIGGAGNPPTTYRWLLGRDPDGQIYALDRFSPPKLFTLAAGTSELFYEWSDLLSTPELGGYFFTRFGITRKKVIYTGSGVRGVPFDQLSSNGYNVAAIIDEIHELCGYEPDESDTTDITATTDGYVISTPASGRACIEQLQQAYFFDAVDQGDVFKYVPRGQAPVLELDHSELAAHAPGEEVPEAIQMVRLDDVQLPRELRVVFVDRDAEYQVGAQTSQRLIGSSDNRQTLELPIVMTNAKARSVADTNIFTAWRERQRFAFRTSYQYADLEPTDVVDIAGENANYRVRLVKRQDDGMRINWEAVNEDLGDYDFNPLAATGPGDPQTPTIPSPPELFVMDIPVLRPEDDHAGVYVAVATEHDFDGAVVSKSADDTAYEQKATLTSVAAAGWCISALGDHTNQHATDEANAIEVFLYSGELATVSYDDMVDENANIAIVGREVVQFREFQGFSGNTFRLTGLRRGRLGTEHEIRDHAGGEPFVLLRAGTIANARMNQNEIGLDRYWKATPFGERIDQAAAYLERFNCNRLKPRAPTLEVLVRDELNDDWEFEGSRRTRYNGQWKNSIEVPLNEAYEQYVIRWFCAAEIGLSGIIYGNPTRLETPGPHGLVAGEYVYIFSAHNATFMVDRWGVILSVPASNLLYVDIDTRGRTTPLGGSSGRFSKMRVQRTLSTLVDSLTVAEQGGGAATRVGIVVTQISETMGEGFPLIAQRTQA